MVDSWSFRANDTASGHLSWDKNFQNETMNDQNMKVAMNAVSPWLAGSGVAGQEGRAVVHRMFSEGAVTMFPDEHFDFIYGAKTLEHCIRVYNCSPSHVPRVLTHFYASLQIKQSMRVMGTVTCFLTCKFGGQKSRKGV